MRCDALDGIEILRRNSNSLRTLQKRWLHKPGIAIAMAIAGAGIIVAFVLQSACSRSVRKQACEEDEANCKLIQSVPIAPRFYADPPYGVGFGCVQLGCREMRIVTLQNRGGGTLVLSRLRLGVRSSADFSLEMLDDDDDHDDDHEHDDAREHAHAQLRPARPSPSEATPYRLGANETLQVAVTYEPSDAIPDEGVLEVRWYDGAYEFEKAIIQKVELPLVARVLGQASAQSHTSRINFGYVAVGTEAQRAIEIENVSTGETILSVTDVDVSGLPPAFVLGLGWENLANRGARIVVPVIFAPEVEDNYHGTVQVFTNDSERASFEVEVVGTSIVASDLRVVDPASRRIDLGALRVGEASASRDVILRNAGGESIGLQPTLVAGAEAGFRVRGPWGEGNATVGVILGPMEDITLTVEITPAQPGALAGQVDLGDGGMLYLSAFGLAPKTQLSPPQSDFGKLAEGWMSEVRTISIQNVGAGDLTIDRLEIEGDATRVRLDSEVRLPVRLRPDDEPLEVGIAVRALSLGRVEAALAVHSDSIDAPTHRAPIAANVVICDEACPVANGKASCVSGACEIGSCNTGWYNTDGELSTGCECQAERGGNEVGDTCSTGLDLGWLGDDCAPEYPQQVMVTGVLHGADDIDLYHLRTLDAGGGCDFLSDSSETRVELVQAPPGLVLCAHIRERRTGCGGYTHQFDSDFCGSRIYKRKGRTGPDDSRDVTAWVMWGPTASPSCGTYLLKFRGRKY